MREIPTAYVIFRRLCPSIRHVIISQAFYDNFIIIILFPVICSGSDNTSSSHDNNINSSTSDHSNYFLYEAAPTKWKVASSSSYGISPCGISSYVNGNLNISKSLVYIKES